MNSPDAQTRLELILRLLSCPSGQEMELLESNIALVTIDLVAMMQQVAERLPRQSGTKDAEWLINLAQQLDAFLRLESQENIAPSNEADQYQVFMQMLQAVLESRGNLKKANALLETHIDQINITWINLLQNWCINVLAQAKDENTETDQVEVVAAILYNVGNLFLEFLSGSLSLNLEIAIASYELALDLYRQLELQENLFQTLTNLGSAYSKQAETGICTSANLKAVESYKEAGQILRELGRQQELSLTLTNLGIAYCDQADFGVDSAINLQRAIAAHLEALEIRRQFELELDCSVTLTNLGNAYLAQAELGIEPASNLAKAIASYTEA